MKGRSAARRAASAERASATTRIKRQQAPWPSSQPLTPPAASWRWSLPTGAVSSVERAKALVCAGVHV